MAYKLIINNSNNLLFNRINKKILRSSQQIIKNIQLCLDFGLVDDTIRQEFIESYGSDDFAIRLEIRTSDGYVLEDDYGYDINQILNGGPFYIPNLEINSHEGSNIYIKVSYTKPIQYIQSFMETSTVLNHDNSEIILQDELFYNTSPIPGIDALQYNTSYPGQFLIVSDNDGNIGIIDVDGYDSSMGVNVIGYRVCEGPINIYDLSIGLKQTNVNFAATMMVRQQESGFNWYPSQIDYSNYNENIYESWNTFNGYDRTNYLISLQDSNIEYNSDIFGIDKMNYIPTIGQLYLLFAPFENPESSLFGNAIENFITCWDNNGIDVSVIVDIINDNSIFLSTNADGNNVQVAYPSYWHIYNPTSGAYSVSPNEEITYSNIMVCSHTLETIYEDSNYLINP